MEFDGQFFIVLGFWLGVIAAGGAPWFGCWLEDQRTKRNNRKIDRKYANL